MPSKSLKSHQAYSFQAGFTVIELLVVIVIIAVLIALTLPNLLGVQRRARDGTRKNDLKNIQHALESYYLDNRTYPINQQGLVSLSPQYMSQIPQDPLGGAYYYHFAASGNAYTLLADLENDYDAQSQNGFYIVQSINR